MIAYIVRRLLYALPILFGVNVITFLLFFVVNSPDDMARMQLGFKNDTPDAIEKWKHERGYHLPLFINQEAQGAGMIADTVFWQKSIKLFVFEFGSSDNGRNIGYDIRQRMWPSLAIGIPTLLIGLSLYISIALMLAFFRGTRIDTAGVVACVLLMSISGLFYIIGGQFLFGRILQLAPISGYDIGWEAIRFLA
ncbi:MAG: ABC transporter permease family protein, partial [Candidatus Eutrophobiaceae bacterium]